jgi:hypothetical protein
MLEEQTAQDNKHNRSSGVSKVSPGWRTSRIPGKDNLWEVIPIVGFQIMQLLCNKGLTIPDVGQAILNAKNTANTKLMLTFQWDGKVSDDEANNLYNKAISELQDWEKTLYPGSNLHGLVNDMISTAMTTGAMCVEWVLNNDLSGVSKAVLAHTPSLRWVSDVQMNLRLYQVSPVVTEMELTKGRRTSSWEARWTELSPYNVVYRAVHLEQGNPYGIPPITPILRILPAHEMAYDNISKTLGKYGIMGFLIVSFAKPKRNPGETDAAYESRLINNLDLYFDRYKDMFKEGVAVGYADESNIDIKDVTGNTSGISDIIQLIEEQMMSALNQDPALAGRTYSTTETYAGVVYDKYLRGMARLQSCASDILSRGILLHLMGKGFPIKSVKVEFDQAKSLTNKMDAEAMFMRQKAAHALFEDGIYDQNQYANKMGEDKPSLPEPRYPYVSDIESQVEISEGDEITKPKRNKNGERQTRGDKEVGVKKQEPRRYR